MMPRNSAAARAGSEILPSIIQLKECYESQHGTSLNSIATAFAYFRTHLLIYCLQRHTLYMDLHKSAEPFTGEHKTQILQSVVGLVSKCLSSDQIIQFIIFA